MFIEVLNIILETSQIQHKSLEFINLYNGLLEYKDYFSLLCISKQINKLVQNKKYLCFNINKLDYKVYKLIKRDGLTFLLYNTNKPKHVKRFVDLFGFVYESRFIYDRLDPEICNMLSVHFGNYLSRNTLLPLHIAVIFGNVQTVKLYLKYTNVNEIDGFGYTPIMLNIRVKPRRKIIRCLIKHKADINYKRNETMLHMAVNENNAELVELLLKNGADPNIKNAHDVIPIFNAISSLKITQLLIPSSDLNAVDSNGNNIIDRIGIEKYLIDYEGVLDTEKIILEEITRRSAKNHIRE